MGDETELRREKVHTGKALQVNMYSYLDWMLADSHASDQSDPVQEEEEEEKEVGEEEKEVDQRVATTTMAPEDC